MAVAVGLLVTAGVLAWPQPNRSGWDALIWQGILVLGTIAGWLAGAVPAVVAARRHGFWILAAYAGTALLATWLFENGSARDSLPRDRAVALVCGLLVPLAAGAALWTAIRRK